MRGPQGEFGWVALRQLANGSWVRVKAQNETLAHFGWENIEPEFNPILGYPTFGISGYRYVLKTTIPRRGGLPMRICRSPVKKSTPAGLTHRFRVTRNCTNRDLALLAVRAQGEWCWMTNKTGKRLDRADWLDFAARVGIT